MSHIDKLLIKKSFRKEKIVIVNIPIHQSIRNRRVLVEITIQWISLPLYTNKRVTYKKVALLLQNLS